MPVFATRTISRARHILSLILLTAGTVPLVAAADEPVYPPSAAFPVTRVVKYDGLDLNSEADARKLYRRLQAAARTVCNAKRSYPPEYIKTMIRPCVSTALNEAVSGLNAPLLSAYHRKLTGSGESDAAVAARE